MQCHIQEAQDYGIMCLNGLLNNCTKHIGEKVLDSTHKATAQRMPHRTNDTWRNDPQLKQGDLYIIPEQLTYEMLLYMSL